MFTTPAANSTAILARPSNGSNVTAAPPTKTNVESGAGALQASAGLLAAVVAVLAAML